MGRYVARRLLLTIPVLLGASFLIFAMVYALPGDPIRALAGDRPLPPAVAAQLREDFNLNDPLIVQYVKYLGDLVQFDLGTDFRGREVSDTISQRLPVTAKLTLVAVLFETVIGLIAGVLAGIRRNGYFDNLVLVSTTLIISIPILVLGFMAQYFLGLKARLVPDRRHQRGLVQLSAARPGAGVRLPGLRGPADPHQHRREHEGRLRPHGQGQGPDEPDGHHAAHAAQQPDPGRHLHRGRHRRAAGRRDRHRGACSTSRASAGRSSTRSVARRVPSSSASSR